MAVLLLFFLAPTGAVEANERLERQIRKISRAYPEVQGISVDSLLSWLASDRPAPLLVDVRSKREFETSHLPDALHIERADSLIALLSRSEEPVVLYCSIGARSAQRAEDVRRQFPGRLYNLEGSIFAWANANLPVEAKGRPTQKVHPYNWYWGRMLEKELHPD